MAWELSSISSRLRGELRVGRSRNGGTQIELQVPAGIVYRAENPKGPRPWNPFRKKGQQNSDFAAD
jgi:hypothetical protein